MIYVVDRYGEAIEADLHETYRLDLLDLLRGRRWRKLSTLIRQLPPRSRYATAQQLDDELVAEAVEQGRQGSDRPGLDEWTLTNALLAEVVDRLGVIPVVLSGDKNARPPKPFPRPVTALERVKDRRAWQKHTSLVDEVRQAQERAKAR